MYKNNYPNNSQHNNDYIYPLEIVHTMKQGKWSILFFILLSTFLAAIYAYGQLPVFKADTSLRIETAKASIPGIDELTGINTDETSIGTEIEIIKSRKNLGLAVDALKLDITSQPKKIPILSNIHRRFISPNETIKPNTLIDSVNAWSIKYAWGNEKIKIDRLDVSKKWLNENVKLIIQEDSSFLLKQENNTILRGNVGQTAVSNSNDFTIFISELTGLPGTEFIISKLSKRKAITNLQLGINALEKGKSTGVIKLSYEGKNEDNIINILDQITKTYVEQNKSRSAEEASNALAFLEQQIKPIKEDVDKAEAGLRQYQTENQTTNLPQESQSILDTVVTIDAELQKYQLSKEELLLKYTKDHPTIQALEAQELKLRRMREETQAVISNLPEAQQKLFELERAIKVSNSIYINLLNKIQEFKIAKASTVGNAYVIDTADIDETFIKPNIKHTILIGGFLGLLLGLFVVFIRKAFRKTIENPDQLEDVTGLPVYATIPWSKKVKITGGLKLKNQKQKSLLAIDDRTDPAIESLRSLRTSLHFALLEAKNNIVMITGPSSNIGKSFITSNLAAVVADTDKRVILVDADMRRGYLSELFNLKEAPGLSDLISLKASISEIIQTVKLDEVNLDIITSGHTPPNPSELLMNEYFSKLLLYLKSNYDLVLIDSPPVNVVTDPTIIGSQVGAVFMVVHPEHNTMKEIEHAISHLAKAGINTKGFILNGYTPAKSYYGYGDYYKNYK